MCSINTQYKDVYDRNWEKIKSGDKKAFEQIFKTYYKDLYGYGLKLCGDSELTKDKIQELFIDLWERKEHIDNVRNLKVYVLISFRRRIIKSLQKSRRHQNILELNYEPIMIELTIEDIIIEDESINEMKEKLQNALQTLTDHQREIIYLRFFNGMSYEEISEILSINYQSTRNLIYRALQNLREVLGNDYTKVVLMAILLTGHFH